MKTRQFCWHRIWSVLGICIFSVVLAQAQTWTVREYGGATAWKSTDGVGHPCGCVIVQGGDDKLITITDDPNRDPNHPLKFEIYWADPNGVYLDEAPLNDFTIDPEVEADLIEIAILRDPNEADPFDPNDVWGASDITKMRLYDPSDSIGESRLKGLEISGNLCGSAAGEDVICDVIAGDIEVGGSLARVGAGAPTLRKLQANSITGDITLGGMYSDIETESLDGDVTVGDTWGGWTGGDFRIGSGYAGTMLFTDPDGYNGSIDIEGDFVGNITVEASMEGEVEIFGNIDVGVVSDLADPGRIWFKRFMTRANPGRPPNVHVHGSIIGERTGAAVIEVGHDEQDDLGNHGTIAIDGSLTNAVTDGPEIRTREIITTSQVRSAIAVDYDGWHDGDDWATGATIVEHEPNFPRELGWVRVHSGNAPEHHVYHITDVRGDIDNTEDVDADDVTAMPIAMVYPDIVPYVPYFVNEYPGL